MYSTARSVAVVSLKLMETVAFWLAAAQINLRARDRNSYRRDPLSFLFLYKKGLKK